MPLDYFEKRVSLFEKIKDSAEVFEGAEREMKFLCNDYNIFCGYQPDGACKGYLGTKSCPAHRAGKEPIDINGKLRRFH